VTRLRNGDQSTLDDVLVVEKPPDIRLNGRRVTATMRTPGHDDLLARGLLLAEGIIVVADDIEELTQSTLCLNRSNKLVHIVDVTLHNAIPAHLWESSLISNSSCGLCGFDFGCRIKRCQEPDAHRLSAR
jgi:FdhD protein